ncbi:hypothetical protein QIS74_07861 [Colletotrichum tabaci]|uniref:Secreted protein n=1 Tax=Colletotrichum tabaci TaxID=1209068 RepID=A0AAV9T6E1_9PEZI
MEPKALFMVTSKPGYLALCTLSARVAYSVAAIGHHHPITPLIASVTGSGAVTGLSYHDLGQTSGQHCLDFTRGTASRYIARFSCQKSATILLGHSHATIFR